MSAVPLTQGVMKDEEPADPSLSESSETEVSLDWKFSSFQSVLVASEQVRASASAEPLRHEEALMFATSWSPCHFLFGKLARDGAGATSHDLGILGTGPRAPLLWCSCTS